MTDLIRALIVDDEPLARSNVRHALAAHARWRVRGEFESVSQALSFLDANTIDIVFLDIQMPRQNGLALARVAAALDPPPIVVFVTAHEAFAVDAFELHALDYLLKPFDDERFAAVVRRVESLLQLRERAAYGSALRAYLTDADAGVLAAADRERTRAPSNFLTRFSVRSIGRIDSVSVADVRWIAAAGNYVELHLSGKVLLHRVTVSALAQRLNPAEFLRVHRSTIVRREECKTLVVTGDGTYTLKLHCGAKVAVSERYTDAVRAAMGQ